MEEMTKVFEAVEAYLDALPRPTFVPGKTPIPYSGALLGKKETLAMVESSIHGWFGLSNKGADFQKKFAEQVGQHWSVMVNSGSSANLVSVSALGLERGSKILTCALGYPTTLSPILQLDHKPIFVDAGPPTYNPTEDAIREAITSDIRAIMLAHTLGNSWPMDLVTDIAEDNDIIILEDTCDALGSTYAGKPLGSFGTLSTCSFYPAHHITTGQGGAVSGSDNKMRRIVESLVSWGKSCWCPAGVSDTCGKRFGWQSGSLPFGYDHKYVFERLGYNLQPLEIQAALGLVQLSRLQEFEIARQRNFGIIMENIAKSNVIRPVPTEQCSPSWFAFPLTVSSNQKRKEVVRHLEAKKISTRHLFGGNLLRQPAFSGIGSPDDFPLADTVMNNTLLVGVAPTISEEMAHFIGSSLAEVL